MDKAVAVASKNASLCATSANTKSRKTILNEETYTENVEKIIVRDFFPDHEHLKDQKEYLEAEERKDYERMRQLALKYAAGGKIGTTTTPIIGNTPLPSPATFETPLAGKKRPLTSSQFNPEVHVGAKDKETEAKNTEEEKEKSNDNVGLDQFLTKYTSEDNQSFEGIMERTEQAKREKHAWLYEAEREHEDTTNKILQLDGGVPSALAITDGSAVIKETGPRSLHEMEADRMNKPIHTWKYKNKNHLMYYPEGVDDTQDKVFKKPRLIEHKNTRFNVELYKNDVSHAKMAQAAFENKSLSGEKIGLDGKSIIPLESPRVGGYGFVATPSPVPGVNQSPLMTWGEIESTPARVDARTPGPSFRFPEDSERDKLIHRMVDENTKKKRATKDAALKQMKASVLGTPKSGSIMSSERINTLSPAARRLVNRKFNLGTDKALKASYTPTPSHRGRGNGADTPIAKTPTPNSRKTPKSTPDRSITDNLLNIPSKTRKSAADFF